MIGKIITLILLTLSLIVSTHFALELKDKSPSKSQKNLLELDIPNDVAQFFKGEVRPVGLSISTKKFNVDFGLQENGWWWVVRPEQTMANQLWVHQWLSALTQSSLMRTLQPEEWDPIGIEDSFGVKLYGSTNVMISFEVVRLKSAPQVLFFELPDGSAIKAEYSTLPELPKSMDEVRTKRLWPFEMEAIKSLTYHRGDKTRTWALIDRKWTTDRLAETQFWNVFFKKWGQWGCTSFIKNYETPNEAVASWEIEFISGDKALLELFSDPIHGWVAKYRGRDMAQVLDQQTFLTCFPEGDF